MTDIEKSAREAMAAMEKSRAQVMECEEEIKSIKNSLKSLTGFGSADESALNRLEVTVHKVKAAGDDAGDDAADDNTTSPTTFKVHLSSPIEERTITQLYDPLNSTAEEGLATFESVETANALLHVEAYSKNESSKLLGVSASHDLLPLCQDMELWRKGGEKKTSTLVVAIVAEKGIDDVVEEVTVEVVEEVTVEPVEEVTVEPVEEVTVEPAENETAELDAPEIADGGDVTKAEEEPESWEDAVDEAEEEPESWEDAVDKEEKEGGEAETETPEEEGAPETADEKEDGTVDETAVEKEDETKESPAEVESEEPKSEPAQDESNTSELQLPIYTLTIQLEYTPSPDDKRDALYEQLNEVSKRKVAAIESLRKNASIINRAKAAAEEASGSTVVSSSKRPAVKPGFLNKSSKASEEKPPPFWKRWYAKTLGPASMLWVVGPIAKNYVIFAGVSLFIHFKGDLLALPPPV